MLLYPVTSKELAVANVNIDNLGNGVLVPVGSNSSPVPKDVLH